VAISTVSLYLTEACNLRCRYCFLTKKPRRLPLDLGREVVDFMLAAPASVKRVSVYFFGGEPLLEFDTLRALTLYGEQRGQELKKGIHFGVTTNGTLLTDEALDFLFGHRISINLSLDGRPETQDANRKTVDGRGSFELVDAVIDRVLKRNPRQGVRMTYDTLTVGSLCQDHEYLWRRGFTNTSPIAVLEDKWTQDSLAVAGEQYRLIAQAVLERIRQGDLRTVGFLAKYIRRIASSGRERIRKPCGVCYGYIGVSVDGTVYPCQRFAASGAYPFGTLNEITAPEHRKLFLTFDANRLKVCEGCVARPVCAGGCPAMNHVCTGSIYEPWPAQCALIRLEYDAARWLYQRLVAERSPMLKRLTRGRDPCREPQPVPQNN